MQYEYHQERRQIPNILNSLGGVVASFLGSQTVVGLPSGVPSAIPSVVASIIPPAASVTSRANGVTSTASARSSAPTPTTLMPTATSASDASQVSAQSTSSSVPASTSKSSSPSIGVIVGAVVGGLAFLILLGILAILCMRRRRKKRQSALPTYRSAEGTRSARSLDETLVDRTPMVQHRKPVGAAVMAVPGREKATYHSEQPDVPMPVQTEMYTSANVWELDSTEMGTRSELDSPAVSRVSSPLAPRASLRVASPASMVSPVVEDRQDRGSGFDFGFEQRRTVHPQYERRTVHPEHELHF